MRPRKTIRATYRLGLSNRAVFSRGFSRPRAPHDARRAAGSSRVVVSPLHGGLSGSIVLRTDPYDADGKPEEPTVTKLDTAACLVQEVKETNFVARLGASAIRVLRGPVFSEEQSTHVLAFAEARITAPVQQHLLRACLPATAR